ncbi:MAG: hypothetical protein UV73_C0003G0007 [Candidatus Gottesmanbacteria bacterium GW2011_GWA2_43_14]|uniref:Uncharacterized protein n=1 Tax=Candidatus Gottesmanbacteria bacterium GW2011_GWA2_43_14 TaxID=1618443 RepID=A0A0G1DJP0_9BACT|nr:MAG: hypothetical protein UV73_C0003G0007 [Candidatus Gottesmanbacteria bacterium GW2011_GWA2_43_14]
MIKLVIFDFDGLLVNSEETVFSAIEEIFLKYGHDFKWSYFLESIGLPVNTALRNYYDHFKLPVKFEEFVANRNEKVSEYLTDHLSLMPYVKEILEYLKKRKIMIAIATSGKKDYVFFFLKKFGIMKYFSLVTTIDDVEKGKPYPDLINKTLIDLGTDSNNALIIEDSLSGVLAAKAAKIKTIAVPTKGIELSLFKDADFICNNLEEAKHRLTDILGN